MIAVQTNDRLYLINMEESEFVDMVMRENIAGRDLDEQLIPLIRAKSGISFKNNDMVHFAKAMVSEISNCFSRVGNRFDMKPVSSVEDLNFYVDENGVQYASEEAYNEEKLLQSVGERGAVAPSPLNVPPAASVEQAPAPTPLVGDSSSAPDPIDSEEDELTSGGHLLNLVRKMTSGLPQADSKPLENNGEPLGAGSTFEPPREEEPDLDGVLTISEDMKRAAGQLDNLVRIFTNVTTLPPDVLKGMRNYVNQDKDHFREYAEQYLSQRSPIDRGELYTDFPVASAFGTTHDMIDSLLVFPVFTHIVSKKDLSNRFTAGDLVHSTFLRVCTVGVDGDRVSSYVQEIKITSQDVRDAEDIVNANLKRQNKSKRSLSAQEKYDLMEAALEDVYKSRKGSLAASKETKLIGDLGRYFDQLVSTQKMFIPSLDDWNSYDVMAFDARKNMDSLPMPLLTQLQNVNGKTPEQVSQMYQNMDDDYNNLYDRKVKVYKVNTSDEAFANGTSTDLGFVIKSENYLGLEVKEAIRSTLEGLVVEGFYYDEAVDRIITVEEYLNKEQIYLRKKQLAEGEKGDDGRFVSGGVDEDPFEKDDEPLDKKTKKVKIFRVDTSEQAIENRATMLEPIEISEEFINEEQRKSIVASNDGYILQGYFFDVAKNDIVTDVEYHDALDAYEEKKKKDADKAMDPNQEIMVQTVEGIFMNLPFYKIGEELHEHIVNNAYGGKCILDYLYDSFSRNFISRKEFYAQHVFVSKYGDLESLTLFGEGACYVELSKVPEELKAKIRVNSEGQAILDSYFYNPTNNSFFSAEELEAARNKKTQEEIDKVNQGGSSTKDTQDEEQIVTLFQLENKNLQPADLHPVDFSIAELSDFNEKLLQHIVEKDGHKYILDYYYLAEEGTFITVEEYNRQKAEQEKAAAEAEDSKKPIPSPLASPAPEPAPQNKPLPPHLTDRRFRPAIVAKIPTVFSGGMTNEKIENNPNYAPFVSLSEDDMDPVIKAALKQNPDGSYTLEGYCYDYDQVRLMTIDEYYQVTNSMTSKPFEPIVSQDTPISMGGTVITVAKKNSEAPAATSAPAPASTDGLTDYVKADGTYVDPTGREWPKGKDSYTLYKMLSDEDFLAEEENKSKK